MSNEKLFVRQQNETGIAVSSSQESVVLEALVLWPIQLLGCSSSISFDTCNKLSKAIKLHLRPEPAIMLLSLEKSKGAKE